jgi:hypothetical protein
MGTTTFGATNEPYRTIGTRWCSLCCVVSNGRRKPVPGNGKRDKVLDRENIEPIFGIRSTADTSRFRSKNYDIIHAPSSALSRGVELRPKHGSTFDEYMRFRSQGYSPAATDTAYTGLGQHFIQQSTGPDREYDAATPPGREFADFVVERLVTNGARAVTSMVKSKSPKT